MDHNGPGLGWCLIAAIITIVSLMFVERGHHAARVACEAKGGTLVTRDWICVKKDSVLK